MKLPPHPNIVQFLGLCVAANNLNSGGGASKNDQNDNVNKANYFSTRIVTEYLGGGNLIKYLRNRVDGQNQDSVTSPPFTLILDLGKGIAAGMDHLHNNNIIHRDLAARNVLIHSSTVEMNRGDGPVNEGIRVIPKISDFGLSVAGTGTKTAIPVRWSAPEVLVDSKNSEKKSDVWSYGVVLFEISCCCTLSPFPEIKNNRDVREAVLSGNHVQFPRQLPAQFVSLAKTCFVMVPSLRPSFSQLFEGLVQQERLLNQRSVGPGEGHSGSNQIEITAEDLMYATEEEGVKEYNSVLTNGEVEEYYQKA
eukprot:TRINITY_DN1868_c0_g1_i1.p1 TRINITY_DN1868_c0_g1~~TRINITY_DN1868_c0_g1_i1.p1  ORF type:complete len:307 (+),score=86.49 TRINITY_DN1868_c0_g1_i1:666-1586(+)